MLKAEKNLITVEEVEKHNTPSDCWVIVDGWVYDLSNYGKIHPGGDVCYEVAGKDASMEFLAYHPNYVRTKKMPYKCIGRVSNPKPERPLDKEYRKLFATVERLGLDKSSHTWHIFKFAYPILMVILGISMACGYFIPGDDINSIFWRAVVPGFLVGFAQHQMGFLAHDTLHCQMTQDWTWDFVAGLFAANFIFGISALWWKYTHNQHHIVTNEWDRDPDITHCPIFAVSEGQYLHKKARKLPWHEKLWLYASPVTFLIIVWGIGRFSMYWQGLYMLFVLNYVPTMEWQPLHLAKKWIWAERVLLVGYLTWFILTTLALPSLKHMLWFVGVTHCITGFLHIQLTLSHYDRPAVFSKDKGDITWFEQQVITGRNIEGTILNEWFLGGLHWQIEHHLFPRAPRHSLSKIAVYVQEICKRYNVHYETGGFWSNFTSVMHTITMKSRRALEEGPDNSIHGWDAW